jgi:hypothetical protein
MKKPIILLALFVLVMVATLVWSAGRDREGQTPPDGINCKAMPPVRLPNGDVNEGGLERWKAKCFSGGKGSSADKYSRGTRLKPAARNLGSGEPQQWTVPAARDDESAQQVKLTLTAGSLVKVDAIPNDGDVDRQPICLCNGQFDESTINRCDGDWRGRDGMIQWSGSSQNRRATCGADASRGKLFFGPLGGRIELESLSGSAEVTSAR